LNGVQIFAAKVNKESRKVGIFPEFLLSLSNQGESFSRCGRRSRFQRDKAASLVSAKEMAASAIRRGRRKVIELCI
jgi:hypothetical protein